VIACPQCSQENPPVARFCNSCGAQLTRDPAAGREVRKTVTVVFCDVVGSTELGERFDPEVLRGVMARFYAAVREPVERHGGTVEKVIGDALVAVFGIPVVHEDDALRAVRAALEMRDAVLAMGEVQTRIGVNTGDVLARDPTQSESLVVGDAVNVAARLEQAAQAGEVLVGADTWALVKHAAHGQRVPPIPAKGKREPLVAWQLEGVDPAAGGHRRRLDLPMVGRESELELLRWTVHRTSELARPHLVVVLGPPGIGKSRLVSEVRALAKGVTMLTGHCRASAGSFSLEPLLEVARGALPEGREVSQCVAELMHGDADAPAVAECLERGAAACAPDVAWAVSRLIGTVAEGQATVILLEDVHWADELLLEVVGQLLRRSRRRSLLVVCTARPEFAEQRPGWSAGANTVSLALERLDDEQTRRLLTSAGPDLDDDQSERIVRAAEGNPLFAEHLAALVGEQDASAGLPRSIQVLLTARLEALPDHEREVVGVAAVAGREFPEAVVEALVGRSIGDELAHLAQRELVEPTTTGRHQFAHTLLQEAAYGLMPKQHRSELHLRLAGWLEEEGAADALVGDHLDRAFTLRAELGQTDDDTTRIGERAGARLAAAGRRADAIGDPLRARLLLERSLELLPANSPGRAAALVELAAAGWNLFSVAQRRRLLTDGAKLAGRLGMRALELRAQITGLGAVSDHSTVEMLEITNAALLELEALDDPRALATALCTRAEAECALGRAADSVESASRALDVLRAVDEDTVWAVSILAQALYESPMPVSAAEALLAQLMEELGVRPTVRLELLQGQSMMALVRGEVDQAWSLLETAQQIEQDIGRTTSLRLQRQRGRMLLITGRYQQAQSALAGTVAQLERVASTVDAAVARSWLGLAQLGSGRLHEARASAIGARDGAALIDAYAAHAQAHRLLSEVYLAEADNERAVDEAREAVAIAAGGDWVILDAETRLTLARALLARGDSAAAAEQAAKARALYEAKGHVPGVIGSAAMASSIISG
jgi:class 3 adenylate cyclase/tetratricopeptide (TPR) repeat protein